jgi:hypothetical protein
MIDRGSARRIRQIRQETLVALRMLYPAALMGEQLLRSLLVLFPQLEWDDFRRDQAYLCEKGYVARVVADNEVCEQATPWRKRWFRVTSSGLEVADRCVSDPALGA